MRITRLLPMFLWQSSTNTNDQVTLYSYRRTGGEMMPTGSLIIVGTGIQATGQITVEARNCIEQADKVLYFVTEPIAKRYLVSLNSTAESMEHFYEEGKNRFVTYVEMVD